METMMMMKKNSRGSNKGWSMDAVLNALANSGADDDEEDEREKECEGARQHDKVESRAQRNLPRKQLANSQG